MPYDPSGNQYRTEQPKKKGVSGGTILFFVILAAIGIGYVMLAGVP